jgi:hypothetical protein
MKMKMEMKKTKRDGEDRAARLPLNNQPSTINLHPYFPT